jgi:hypothetical protein
MEGVPLTTKYNVSRTHVGSQWNGQRFSPQLEILSDQPLVARRCQLAGVSMFGEEPASTVPNELNYRTFAHFAYSPDEDLERFIDEDLGPLFGGRGYIRHWLGIVREVGPPRDPNVPLEQLPPLNGEVARRCLGEAQEIAESLSGEPERRWRWTVRYLEQRIAEESTRGAGT